jgi:hypothetical protein
MQQGFIEVGNGERASENEMAPGFRRCRNDLARIAMTIVVFADGTNPCAITARRSRVRERLLARLRVWRLDNALAEGVSPDTSAVTFLHAQALVGLRCRRRLARELRKIMSVRGFARPFDPVITVPASG